MEYQKKEIRIFQNGRTVNDQFYIDGDYNVPEAKRDVGKIILSNGMLRVEEMKQVESYLKVSGKLEFKVLYMADEMVPVPASLEGRIPFEEMIYLEQEPEGNLVLQTSDTEVTVTMIHSRKLNIQTQINLSKCFQFHFIHLIYLLTFCIQCSYSIPKFCLKINILSPLFIPSFSI